MKLSNPVSPLYPWQKDIWSRLSNTGINNRIAHALLFTGSKGVGKLQFAKTLKNSLLCSENTPGELACGECRFCKIQQHPDFHEVTFEEDERTGKISNSIKIDQIRKLIDFSLLHTHYGLAKIITIHPAEAMTNNAANALLKILEEPPDNTYFVLICNEIHRISATIKSRCQRVEFDIPDIEDSILWLQSHDISEDTASSCLKFANNAPLTARILAETNYSEQHSKLIKSLISIANKYEDPMVIANSWLKIESSLPLHALYSCLSDIILLKTVQNSSEITNKLNRDILQNIANNVGFTGLYVILDKIILAKPQIQSNVAILGIYEDILNLWQRLTNNVIPQVHKG